MITFPADGRRAGLRPFPLIGTATVILVFVFLSGVLWGSRRGIPLIDEVETWSIGIFDGTTFLDLAPSPKVRNPVLTAHDVTDAQAEFVADPFGVEVGGRHFLFFEVLNRETGHGDIALAESADGFEWSYRKIVLDEPFHLSFPHVFQWNGSWYMVPESEKDLSVRLYRASDFPLSWEFIGTILEGEHFVDPVLFRHDGLWWLFVSPHTNDILNLFYSVDLMGPWMRHPMSPIISGDPNRARAGGRVFSIGDRVFRLAQDDSPSYGNRLRVFEILELSSDDYAEAEISEAAILGPSGSGWNRDGMHHLDPHPSDGGWVGYVDGRTTTITFGWRF